MIVIEYTSIIQLPMVMVTIIKNSIRKMDVILTCGEYKIGVLRYLVIPRYKLLKTRR